MKIFYTSRMFWQNDAIMFTIETCIHLIGQNLLPEDVVKHFWYNWCESKDSRLIGFLICVFFFFFNSLWCGCLSKI
jgi:hypothetical protein